MTYTVDAYGVRFTLDPKNQDWTYDCDGHRVPLVDGEPDYTRRILNDGSDCAPPSYDGWIEQYVQQHVDHELNRVSWSERLKNSVELRAKLEKGWPTPGDDNEYEI